MKTKTVILNLKLYLRRHFEWIAWVGGLSLLAFLNPMESHWSICPLDNMGLDLCPGCGLGRSVGFLLRGDLSNSWHAHPLGFFALAVLVYRIIYLIRKSKFTIKNN